MRWQMLIPVVSTAASCLFLSVFWWSLQRRKEREAFYRYELFRLMIEKFGDDREGLLAWMREHDMAALRQRIEGLRLSATILLFGGFAVLVGLGFTTKEDSIFGWLPVGVGVAIFVHLFATRETRRMREE